MENAGIYSYVMLDYIFERIFIYHFTKGSLSSSLSSHYLQAPTSSYLRVADIRTYSQYNKELERNIYKRACEIAQTNVMSRAKEMLGTHFFQRFVDTPP